MVIKIAAPGKMLEGIFWRHFLNKGEVGDVSSISADKSGSFKLSVQSEWIA